MNQFRGHRTDNNFWNRLPALTLLSCTLLLGACASQGVVVNTPSNNQAESKASTPLNNQAESKLSSPISEFDRCMADDLATVVTQVFNPLETTLQVNRANSDPLIQHFVTILADAGFGIQRVSADQGAHFLSYDLQQTQQKTTNLTVNIGSVAISREYKKFGLSDISPMSMMRLSGTRVPVTVKDNDPNSVLKVLDPSLSQPLYVASLSLEEQTPVISLITPELVNNVASQSTNGPSLQALNSSKIEVNNLFYGSGSTFASILENHKRVDRQVVIFGDDSMVLGDANKQLIDEFVETRLKNKDVISLVGCSNGPTSLDIGNEGLALGRGKRVTQALVSRGVARDRILDEGCWAPTTAGDRFPSRGVVMELWRKNS